MGKRLSRRDFLRMAALATGGVALAACAPQATAQPTAAAAAPTSAPAAAEAKTVRLGVWAGPEEVIFFNKWVKPYTDQGNKVNIEYVDWTTYWTKLPTQFSAGTAADVLEMSNYTLQFGPQGVLADLNQFFSTDTSLKKDDYVAVPFEKFTYQGKLISFPLGLTIQTLAYNKDIFDKAGEPYPDNTWDWNKMVEVALKFLSDMINKDQVAPSPAAQAKFGGSAFQAGQAAFSRVGTYMLTPYKQNIKSFVWDVTVPPKGPKARGVMADGIGWSMSSSSPVKDDAWKLIKYFNTSDGQILMGSEHWQVPILKSAFDSFGTTPPEHIASLKEEFDYGHRWPAYTNQQQVDDFITQKTTDIFNNVTTPEVGLKEIQDYVAPLVKG
jgi:ABC-type glycerol-3-phosphate transport system substrate-binding protein